MIIIPEKNFIIITPPKCGSTSLHWAVRRNYGMAFTPYRHMEADGIPYGYSNYQVFMVVRKPLLRMWSLYNYYKAVTEDKPNWEKGRVAQMNNSAKMPFLEWLQRDEFVFAGGSTDHPHGYYQTLHPMPERMKSLAVYGGGREIFPIRLENLNAWAKGYLGIELPVLNSGNTKFTVSSKTYEAIGALPHMKWDAFTAGGWF